jgi:hypothetical protein
MKSLLSILTLTFLSTPAFAQEVPEYLKGAKISVTLANGKSYSFSSEEYAVVKRSLKKEESKPEQAPAVPRRRPKRSTAIVHGGAGFDGHKVTSSSNSVTVEQKLAPVFGVTLGTELSEDSNLSIFGSVFTNSTVTIGIGAGF